MYGLLDINMKVNQELRNTGFIIFTFINRWTLYF